MTTTRQPRRLITIRALASDPERQYPDAEVLLTAETTEDSNLVVAAYAIRQGGYAEGFAGDFAVIHVPSGLPIAASLTHSVQHARALAGRLADTAVDWSRRKLSEEDAVLAEEVRKAIAQFQKHDAPEHRMWAAI